MEQNIPRRKKEETQDKQKSSCRVYQPIMIDLIPMAVFYYHELHTLYHFSTSQKKKSTKKGRKKSRLHSNLFPARKRRKSSEWELRRIFNPFLSSLFFLFPSSIFYSLFPLPSPPPFFPDFTFFPPIIFIICFLFYFIILYYYLSFVGYFGLSLLFGLFYLVLPLFPFTLFVLQLSPTQPQNHPSSLRHHAVQYSSQISIPSIIRHSSPKFVSSVTFPFKRCSCARGFASREESEAIAYFFISRAVIREEFRLARQSEWFIWAHSSSLTLGRWSCAKDWYRRH